MNYDQIAKILRSLRPDKDRTHAFAHWSKTVRTFSEALEASGGDSIKFLRDAGHST